MHFKLDLKEEGKRGENGTFSNQTFTFPLFVVLENWTRTGFFGLRLCFHGGTAGKVLPRSEVPSMAWSETGRGDATCLPHLGAPRCSWNVLSWNVLSWNNPRSRFFSFPVFVVHELFVRDRQAAPAAVVLVSAGSVGYPTDYMEDPPRSEK